MAPVFFDPHVCSPPRPPDLPRARGPIRYRCQQCGRDWQLEHFHAEKTGAYLGSSWILD